MGYKTKELFESELTLLRGREKHPYLQNLLGYLHDEDLILDLGCGLLVNLTYLKDNGFHVVGVDISFEMMCEKKTKGLPLICADGLELPFKKNSFGGLLLIDIIEHLPREKVDEFMEEVKRVLKEGGIIFLHVPLEKSLTYRLLNKFGVIWPRNPNHLHDYNLKEIVNFIKGKRYKILWDHKWNGMVYSLQYHIKEVRSLIVTSKLLGRFLQNVFTTAYTACLSIQPRSESDH
jgi:SAM-dependent methyltransferase